MPFSPDMEQARQLFLDHGAQLFALCYLHAGGPKGANRLLSTLLCDLSASPRCHRLALSGRAGLFRCAHNVCLEQYYKRPKRKKKPKGRAQEPPARPLPFVMTDSLRALLDLPPRYKTPLCLRTALGWSAAETAAAAGIPASRVDKLADRALKKAGLTPPQARQALSAVAPLPDGPQEQWDLFLIDREDKTFRGRQRLRLFKRFMDRAIPYIALGVIAFCVLAYQGVEHGWFTGQGYVPAAPVESQAPGDYATGTATIYGMDGADIIQYNVTDCPLDPETLLRQMVALGGAPEGTRLLSVRREGPRLSLELSREAAQADEPMLSLMAATLSAAYPDIEELVLTSAGEELLPPHWLGAAPTPERTVSTPYHE